MVVVTIVVFIYMVTFLIGLKLKYNRGYIWVSESDDKIEAIEFAKKGNANLSNSVKFISLVKDLNEVKGWVVMEKNITYLPVDII